MSDKAAAQLMALAHRARRLPPPSHRDPEAFHIARSDLGAEIEAVARMLVGRIDPPRVRRRPTPATQERIGGRIVMVQVRRKAFAV